MGSKHSSSKNLKQGGFKGTRYSGDALKKRILSALTQLDAFSPATSQEQCTINHIIYYGSVNTSVSDYDIHYWRIHDAITTCLLEMLGSREVALVFDHGHANKVAKWYLTKYVSL